MKSEKAKKILARSYDGGHVLHENAEAAVDQAESDIREKAIEAYIQCCEYEYIGRCMYKVKKTAGIDCEMCKGRDCPSVKSFIQKIDEA